MSCDVTKNKLKEKIGVKNMIYSIKIIDKEGNKIISEGRADFEIEEYNSLLEIFGIENKTNFKDVLISMDRIPTAIFE